MYLQKVRNRKMGALKGLGVVAGIFAALFITTFITQILIPVIGEAISSLLFWGVGALIALWTMRRFVLSYSYGLGANVLRITFAYGRYERVMTDLYFNNIRHAGTLEEMRKRYPSARVNRATRPGCDIEPLAVAARDNGVISIYLLQPDETIRAKLIEAVKANH